MKLSNWSPKRFNAEDVSNAEWGYQVIPHLGGFLLFQYGATLGGDCWRYVRDEVGQPIVYPTWGMLIAHVVEMVTRSGGPTMDRVSDV